MDDVVSSFQRSGRIAVIGIAALIGVPPAQAHDPRPSAPPSMQSLPLRDGNRSTDPRRDHVMSCKTDFSGGRGSVASGQWLGSGTWDATQKIYVDGSVWWPNARFMVTRADYRRQLSGNALPTDHPTGVFPVRHDDPAFRIDPNPNGIQEKAIEVELPRTPRLADAPSCLPMGMIGVMLNGVALFNALDTRGKDALAHEVQDRCGGHPERTGHYHYHGMPTCLSGVRKRGRLVGYALDGFGIYTAFDRDGHELTNADLDECHGRTARVLWDDQEVEMYHYVLTREYPYTLGCFRGRPVRTPFTGGGMGLPPRR